MKDKRMQAKACQQQGRTSNTFLPPPFFLPSTTPSVISICFFSYHECVHTEQTGKEKKCGMGRRRERRGGRGAGWERGTGVMNKITKTIEHITNTSQTSEEGNHTQVKLRRKAWTIEEKRPNPPFQQIKTLIDRMWQAFGNTRRHKIRKGKAQHGNINTTTCGNPRTKSRGEEIVGMERDQDKKQQDKIIKTRQR